MCTFRESVFYLQVDALHVESGELDTAAKQATAQSLCHGGNDILNVTVTEGLVLDVRVRGDVAWESEKVDLLVLYLPAPKA